MIVERTTLDRARKANLVCLSDWLVLECISCTHGMASHVLSCPVLHIRLFLTIPFVIDIGRPQGLDITQSGPELPLFPTALAPDLC